MSLDSYSDDSLDFDLVAASLRADASDLNAFIETIATKLETALPGGVRVTRVKRGFRGPKVVAEISVEAGGERLDLRRNGAAVDAVRAKISGGIVLKTERIDIDAWIGSLSQILSLEAQRSLQTRQALARLLDT